jgi:hypothetical protein
MRRIGRWYNPVAAGGAHPGLIRIFRRGGGFALLLRNFVPLTVGADDDGWEDHPPGFGGGEPAIHG